MLLNGLPLQAFDGPVLHDLFNVESDTDRVLVLIQLSGGNDGLNMVVPLSEYSTYKGLRGNIAIPENAVLKLRDDVGVHPAMTGVHALWNQKKVNLVQGVTYPNPNLSHFRSTDIWMTGSASNVDENSGWLGRYLNGEYPNYPDGYPNAAMPDPIAIQMTAVASLALTGLNHQSMGIALQDPESFYRLVSGSDTPGSDLPSSKYAADNITYVRDVQVKSQQFSTVIKAAADKATNKETYPTANKLADQLKIVARLIAGGLKTRVYVVQMGGFDTHAAQVDASDTTIGAHAGLLKQVSDAVSAFQKDIEALGAGERVVSMTFSEFGRRVESNLSLGTDHGTAAPLFFFGIPVEDGIIGTNPSLTDLDNKNLKMQYDFRQIYASVLEQWFSASPTVIRNVLFDEFKTVRVIKKSTTDVDDTQIADTFSLDPIAPNPVRTETSIRYTLKTSQNVRLEIFDSIGFHVATLVNEDQSPGAYVQSFVVNNLPSGTYFVQLRANGDRRTQAMVVVR
ncbi:MAG: DUF1501 domain-containing protein [Candidatus Kapabacteria bacterium]|nr:DUF1501 domain-containing protein [Candidatus Kapabacteria bacterium]